MCDIDFDGSPDFWTKTHPVARKTHRCAVCRGTIKPGEKYLREAAKWEGDVSSDACCLPCEADRDAFGKEHGGYPFVNWFAEALRGCIYEGDEESDTKWQPMLDRIERRRLSDGAVTP